MKLGQIATVFALISSIIGGVYVIEDRYQKTTQAICINEKNNKYTEQTVNTLRIELFTNKLMKAPPSEQSAILLDLKALQARQNKLTAELTKSC